MRFRPRIRFNGSITPPIDPPAVPERAGGWADLYNGGIGVTGAGDIAPTSFSNWEDLWDDLEATPILTPKRYLYTGTDVNLSDVDYRKDFTQNKTIEASAGQRLQFGTIRMVEWKNCIFRNFRRRKSFNDAIRVLGCEGMWFDHIEIDGEATVQGTSTIGDGGLDITSSGETPSDYITISNSYFHNCERTVLISASNDDIQSRGKKRVTFRNCHFRNNHIRQPFARFGKIHLLNNLYDYDPRFTAVSGLQYQWARCVEVGFEAQIYSQANYYKGHRYAFYDQDPTLSGILSDGDWFDDDHFDPTRWNPSIVPIRPSNVIWNPNSTIGYNFPIALMTPEQARTYALTWAGAKYHLKYP